MLKALIFDVDGTLADTEKDGHRIAFNSAFKAAGLDWEWDEELYGKLLAVTGGKERMNYYLDHFNTSFERPDNLQEMIANLHKSKTGFYTKLLGEGSIPLRSGVKRLILEARDAGLRLAIATTTTPENVTALLENTLGKESIDWFEVIAAGDIVPAKKPASDIYDWALKEMDLDAADCLAFEDSENGILSSQGANLKTIITVNDYTLNHDFTGAAVVLDNLGEPEQAFSIIAGDAGNNSFINLQSLTDIHAG